LEKNDVSLCFHAVKIEGTGHTLRKNRIHENRNAVVLEGSKCTVAGNEITDHINGVGVAGSHNTIDANRFDWVGLCINVYGAHNRIVGNQLKRFSYGGITLHRGSADNHVEHNTCEAGVYPFGISVDGSTGNAVLNNRIVETTGGIELKRQANGNRVEGNHVSAADIGLSLTDSTGNYLRRNVLADCTTSVRTTPKWRHANTIEQNDVK